MVVLGSSVDSPKTEIHGLPFPTLPIPEYQWHQKAEASGLSQISPSVSGLRRLIHLQTWCQLLAPSYSHVSGISSFPRQDSAALEFPPFSIPSASSLNQAFCVTCHRDENQTLQKGPPPPVSSVLLPLARKCSSSNSACRRVT